MAEPARLLAGAGAALLILGLLGGFTRPLGDFGRPEPDVLHDDLMPVIGDLRAKLSGEPVSSFNRTDEEIEMANRIWRFETSGHVQDWLFDAAAELRRTRIEVPPGAAFADDRYYKWLHRTAYRSAGVRYATVVDDIDADLATLPDAFAAICKVEAVDRQRQVVSGNLSAGMDSRADLAARLAENDSQIGGFVDALSYRYRSYDYALDHLLLETPDAAARQVDQGLGALDVQVHFAEHGDFCGWTASPDLGSPRPGNPHPAPVVPSRFIHGNPPAATRSGPIAGS